MASLSRAKAEPMRPSQRGAVLLEAIVVIPFFILTLAVLIFAGAVYSTKLRAMRDAKSRVWSYAMANCGEAGNGAIGDARNWNGATSAYDGNPTSTVPMNGAGSTQGAQGTQLLQKDVNAAVATVEYTARSDWQIGAHEVRPRAVERVLCNEPPYDADLRNVMSRAWSTLTGW